MQICFSALFLFPLFPTFLSPLFKFIFFFLSDSIYLHMLEQKYWVTLRIWFGFSIIASCQEVFKRCIMVLLRDGGNLMYVTMMVTLTFTFFRGQKMHVVPIHITLLRQRIFSCFILILWAPTFSLENGLLALDIFCTLFNTLLLYLVLINFG